MAGHLDVTGRVDFTIGGESGYVFGDGPVVVTEFPGRRSLGHAVRASRIAGGSVSRCADRVHAGLTTSGLSLEVRVRGRRVARLGVGARAGWLSRLLGFGPAEVDLFAVARTYWRG